MPLPCFGQSLEFERLRFSPCAASGEASLASVLALDADPAATSDFGATACSAWARALAQTEAVTASHAAQESRGLFGTVAEELAPGQIALAWAAPPRQAAGALVLLPAPP
mmetsp:Transcript_46653/g.82247  ORF Transcript_46653/g.82247 Transcript_46653/m.82247 type:complete len:110 (-) Transcript_46653:181-510(-)